LRAHVHHHAFPWSWSGEVNRKLCASEVDPGGFGPRERDGLAVVEGNDEHGAGEHVPDPIQQPGSGRSIEALGRFVEQEDVGPSEKSLRYAEAPALAAGEGYAARANWRFEPERDAATTSRAAASSAAHRSMSPAWGSARRRLSRMVPSKT